MLTVCGHVESLIGDPVACRFAVVLCAAPVHESADLPIGVQQQASTVISGQTLVLTLLLVRVCVIGSTLQIVAFTLNALVLHEVSLHT